ncbi:Protein priA [Vanrija pseudolonga]|uniref:Protein priA n=1 Tax=Vanrija pseudolonga TaxID=143232 RepID=A0AAF0Y6X2_9TREE|nr:Protein priA [Vanrija pseudolonga]
MTLLLVTLALLLVASASADKTPPTLAVRGIEKRAPIDPSTTDACTWGCWQQAATAASCDKYDTQCTCMTNRFAFDNAYVPCVLFTPQCSASAATTFQSSACQYGFELSSAAARRRGLERALVPSCPGKKVCRTRRGSHKNLFHNQLDNGGDYDGYECVDVMRELEACGGCPGVDGVDCTALEGAGDVACVGGLCEVRTCERGYRRHRGVCI